MQYRELAMPDAGVLSAIGEDAQRLTQKGGAVHRHLTLILLWEIAEAVGNRVPVGMESPVSIIEDKNDRNFASIIRAIEHFAGVDYEDLKMGGEPTAKQVAARAAFRDTLLAWWMACQSVSYSDTPNYYSPTEDLLYALAATNLKGVTAADIRLPFPAIYIEFPKGAIRAQVAGEWLDVSCIGVSSSEAASDIRIIPPGRNLLLDVSLISPGHAFARITDHFDMSEPGVPLDQLLGHREDYVSKEACFTDRLSVFGHEDSKFYNNHRAFNMILGFLLYLQQNKATLSRAPTKKVKGKQRPAKLARAEAKRVLSANSWISGVSCKIDKEVKEAIRGGWSVNRTHSSVVAGHYRRYRVGPRDDWTYEVKWIKPFKRGSKGPILGHSYEGGKT